MRIADEFADRLNVALPSGDFTTMAGLVIQLSGELPRLGQSVSVGGLRLEVVDMDGRRIDKLFV
ncbi:transporter associated domain-containing protein [Roseivivax sediminis]|uniref:Transporter associated domain-containing protein n=1 Tax=Roseivivax sediminis TaxID=936889 RepID=A0A1I2CNZ2_9RHOB|nr:transporter associated domain-containing protein [Roseivivax sediminis]SFE69988.1 Transporter associated domain-containing protein [Roseivivax sediminis]